MLGWASLPGSSTLQPGATPTALPTTAYIQATGLPGNYRVRRHKLAGTHGLVAEQPTRNLPGMPARITLPCTTG